MRQLHTVAASSATLQISYKPHVHKIQNRFFIKKHGETMITVSGFFLSFLWDSYHLFLPEMMNLDVYLHGLETNVVLCSHL